MLLDEDSAESTARELAARVQQYLAATGRELTTYLIGVTFDDPQSDPVALDDWRSRVKRRAANILFEAWAGRREPAFRHADLVFVWDVARHDLEVRVTPVFVYGRYIKTTRDLPQTRWHCKRCRGSGCAECGRTGRLHPSSVEERIGDPLARAHGSEPAILHGMGREDLDVRTLAPGRPFVVELRQPTGRIRDLDALAREIASGGDSKVELAVPLRYVDPAVVTRVKTLDPKKRYRALVKAAAPLDPGRVAALGAAFTGRSIDQETPARVAHRRADLVRARRVLELEATPLTSDTFELRVLTEAGTYIKELVSGDGGRSRPSIAEHLGVAAVVAELDVIDVLVDEAALLAVTPPPRTRRPR